MANKLPAIGDIRYKTGEENPYKGRSKTIKKTYAGYETNYNNQQKNMYEQNVAEANKSAENAHRQQYISYMQNRKDLPNMLAQQGMNGGVGETSRLNLTTNYQNNRNATDAQRAAQIQAYRNAMNNNISTFQQTNQQAMQAALDENQERYDTWNSTDLNKQKQIYADTISGYTDPNAIRKEIARIRRTGVDTWRIAYLEAQLATLDQLDQGGSSGGGGYTTGGGYTPTITEDPTKDSGNGSFWGSGFINGMSKAPTTSGNNGGGGGGNNSGGRTVPVKKGFERAPFGAQYPVGRVNIPKKTPTTKKKKPTKTIDWSQGMYRPR